MSARDEVSLVPRAVADALGSREEGVVLAVSGGRDSMALLHAAGAVARSAVRAVATFDHGTGAHATEAVALVRATAAALGVPVVSGTATRRGRTEAEWRDARWAFLREAAAVVGARVVATAHTADDQVETVVARALRRAGARGLSALAAPSSTVVRPFVALPRAEVAAYATAHALPWSDDPSNADRRHQRVRFRADLLPAIARVRPGATARLLDVGARAAQWRAVTEAWVASAVEPSCAPRVPVSTLAACSADALGVFWPAFAARASVRLDRRALARLVAYTPEVVRRIGDGTVQPARVPVAGTTGRAGLGGAVVTLAYGPRATGDGRGAWAFAVRPPTRGASDLARTADGAAGPHASDYPESLIPPLSTRRP